MSESKIVTYPYVRSFAPVDFEVELDDAEIIEYTKELSMVLAVEGGVGLAAPQIGVPIPLVLIKANGPEKELGFWKPVITYYGEETKAGPEACLSLPGYAAMVTRSTCVSVNATMISKKDGQFVVDRTGEFMLDDFEAIVAQHEIDHLNDKIFIDRLAPLTKSIFLKKIKKCKPYHNIPEGALGKKE